MNVRSIALSLTIAFLPAVVQFGIVPEDDELTAGGRS